MTKRGRLRVLIAEDDATMRAALAELMDSEPTFQLVGTAVDATEAIHLAASTQPDVVLVDVRMPGGGGVAAVRGINRCSPDSKVIALSVERDRTTVMQMLEAGSVGYLLKGGAVEEIIGAIKRASEGHGSLSIELTGDVIDELAAQLIVRSKKDQRHRRSLERICRALQQHDRLAMVFQPIVTLRDRKTVGAEALARFAGPPQRTPNLWFAEAAVVGLRTDLEILAVQRAIAALPELPPGTYLTINASPATLTRRGFYKLVSEADGSRLVAEITEHTSIDDYARLAGALDKLRVLGMRLAIDDAGAGYASLRHILELGPEFIKLDISLIRDIDQDSSKQALVAGLIAFANKSGSSIIAEGIEQPTETRTLIELGAEQGQGYFFGRPGPLPL